MDIEYGLYGDVIATRNGSGAIDDANNACRMGTYITTPGTKNAPNWGIILTISHWGGNMDSSNWIKQFWFEGLRTIHFRAWSNRDNPTAWSIVAFEDQLTDVNLSGYATQDWVKTNFSNVKATLVGSNLGKMLSLSANDSLSTILTKVGDGESLYGRFNAALKFLHAHTPEWGGHLDKVKIVKRNTTYTISLGADEGRWEYHYTYHPFHNRFLRTNRSVLDWVYPDNYGFAQSGGMACGNAYPLNSHPTAQFTPNNAGVWILWLAGNPTGDNIVSNYSLIICIG